MLIWRQIVGYEGLYSVSNNGDVRSEDRVVRHYMGGGKNLKGAPRSQFKTRFGYFSVSLAKNGENRKHHVHRLVLSAFVRQPNEGEDCCHIDGVRTNNNVENLRWDTRTGNMADTEMHGTRRRGEDINFAKLNEEQVAAILCDNRKQNLIADEYGICQSAVSRIKNRNRWKHL